MKNNWKNFLLRLLQKNNWNQNSCGIFHGCFLFIVSVFEKGFFKLVPILIGLVGGYLSYQRRAYVRDWLLSSQFWTLRGLIPSGKLANPPSFQWDAIALIAPIAFVTFMEHIGDITTNGSVVGQDFLENPGLHRPLPGDGLATIAAGLLGGPANTTCSENTGVLAVTKVYDTVVLKIAAIFAIALELIGKFGAVLLCIPNAVKDGLSVVLFGMSAAVGMRTLTEAKLDCSHSQNLLITALILVFGLGMGAGITI
ncbi:MAG: solute carrier family 23 protein [Oscillospiraceae bacterium]